MNDDWSRCPICYEDYSIAHRPTTFICGHSTCIEHTFGDIPLRECPICRRSLHEQKEFNVSYNLEEASRLYHMIRFPSVETQTGQRSTQHHEYTDTQRLPTKSNHQVLNEESVTRPSTILAFIFAALSGLKKGESTHQQEKKCGHFCFLTATSSCCSCSDQRPYTESNQYNAYIDGYGFQQVAKRHQHYCPECKQREG